MKTVIAFLSIALLFFSCKKDDTNKQFTLPDKTQTGQQTFGFLLNSNVWTNYRKRCTFYGCGDNLVGIYYSDGDINVHADRVLFKNGVRISTESFGFTFPTHFRGVGTYSSLNNDSLEVGYSFSDTSSIERYYILSQTNPVFTVTLTKIDTINKILCGEFSGKLFRRTSLSGFSTSLTDSIRIEEGRFDIRLK